MHSFLKKKTKKKHLRSVSGTFQSCLKYVLYLFLWQVKEGYQGAHWGYGRWGLQLNPDLTVPPPVSAFYWFLTELPQHTWSQTHTDTHTSALTDNIQRQSSGQSKAQKQPWDVSGHNSDIEQTRTHTYNDIHTRKAKCGIFLKVLFLLDLLILFFYLDTFLYICLGFWIYITAHDCLQT